MCRSACVYRDIKACLDCVITVFAEVTHLGSASYCSLRQVEAHRYDKGENKFGDY